jgi:hypothetical protein
MSDAALSALKALYESVIEYKKADGNDVKEFKDSEAGKTAYSKFYSEFSKPEGSVMSESVEEVSISEEVEAKIGELVDSMLLVSDIAESVAFDDFLNSIQGAVAVKKFMAKESVEEEVEPIEESKSESFNIDMLSEEEADAFKSLFNSIVEFISESEEEDEEETVEEEDEEEEKSESEEEKDAEVEEEEDEEKSESEEDVDEAIDISKIKIGKLVRSGRKNRKMSKAAKLARKRPRRKMTAAQKKRAKLYQAARRKKLKMLGIKPRKEDFEGISAIIPYEDEDTFNKACSDLGIAFSTEDGEACVLANEDEIKALFAALNLDASYVDYALGDEELRDYEDYDEEDDQYEDEEDDIQESVFDQFIHSEKGYEALKKWSGKVVASGFKISECIEPKLNKLCNLHVKALEEHISDSLKNSPIVTMGVLNESQSNEIKVLVSEAVKEMADLSITSLKEDMINTCEAYVNEEVIPSILDTFDKKYIPLIKDSLTEEINEYVTYAAKTIASNLSDKNLILKSRKTMQLENFENELLGLIKDKLSIIPEQEDELNKLEERNAQLRENLQNANIEKVKMKNKILELRMENYVISHMPESLSESFKEKLLGYVDEVLMESCTDMDTFKAEFRKACNEAEEAEQEEKIENEDSMKKFKKEEKECDCKDGEKCDKCEEDEEEIEESEEELKQKFVEIANKLKKLKKEAEAEKEAEVEEDEDKEAEVEEDEENAEVKEEDDEEAKEDAVNESMMERIMRAGGKVSKSK